MQTVIDQVAQELHIPVEAVPIDEFVPIPQGADDRRLFIGQFGFIDVYVLDPYTIALSKLDRGLESDIEDIRPAYGASCTRPHLHPRRSATGRAENGQRLGLALKRGPLVQVDQQVLELLRELLRRKVKVAVLSNAAPEEVAAWPESPLSSFINVTIFSCDVGLVKPDAAIYELACAKLGVEPGDALFVGDGGSDELNGAANAGLTPLWATYFLDQWPAWKESATMREAAARFPRLCAPHDLYPYINRQ